MCKWSLKLSHIEGNRRAKTIKYLSLSFVVVFLLHGVTMVAVSIWLEVSNIAVCDFLTDELYWLPVHIQLSSGCLTVIVCVSSLVYTIIKRANGFVRIFSCLLVVVIVLEILSAIVAGIMVQKSYSHLKQGMLGNVESINSTGHDPHGDVKCWTQLQQKYECCGISGYSTWQSPFKSSDRSATELWDSCECHDGSDCEKVNGQNIYSLGCYKKLQDKINFVLTFIRCFGPTFAVLQCLAYISLHVIFAKMYRNTVIATYTAKGSLGHVSDENYHVTSVT